MPLHVDNDAELSGPSALGLTDKSFSAIALSHQGAEGDVAKSGALALTLYWLGRGNQYDLSRRLLWPVMVPGVSPVEATSYSYDGRGEIFLDPSPPNQPSTACESRGW